MKKILFLFLLSVQAFATYSPQTIITDGSTGVTASVNSSNELETFLASDSNVCKESGGNLAAILAALTSSLPLPTGAATSANQTTIIANQTNGAQETQVTNFPSSQNVVVTNSPTVTVSNPDTNYSLESGGHLESIDTKITTTSAGIQVDASGATVPVTGSLGRTWTLSNSTDSASCYEGGTWTVGINNFPSTFGVTQSTSPWVVSGTVTSNIGTTGGLALDSSLSTINTTLGIPFQSGGSIGNTSFIATQSTGSSLHTDVDNFPATQAISAASLPLPTGASTSANQSTIIANQTNGTQETQVTNFPATQAVSAVSLPLPTGAATSANQTNGNQVTQVSALPSIPSGTNSIGQVTANAGTNLNTSLLALESGGNLSSINTKITTTANGIKVDGSAVTQPVSASSLPLPAGASTSANQTNASQKTQVVDGSGNVYGPTTTLSGTNYLPVVLAASGTPGSANPGRSISIGGSDGTDIRTISTDTSGNVNVNNVGHVSLTTFTQSYTSSNLSTSAFTTIITSTTSNTNAIDIFDNSGGIYYIAYAATCGALAHTSNAIFVGPGGGEKDFLIPSGNCVGFEANGTAITSGNVYMTFYR